MDEGPTEDEKNEARSVLANLCKKLDIRVDDHADKGEPASDTKADGEESSSSSSSDESAGPILKAVLDLQKQVKGLQESLDNHIAEARIHWNAEL